MSNKEEKNESNDAYDELNAAFNSDEKPPDYTHKYFSLKQKIINAYIRIRKIDNTIPDEILDFMKDAALEKVVQLENNSEWNLKP